MIFSLDASISFTIMLIGALIFAGALAEKAQGTSERIESFELEEKALMAADSMVKNYDENNTLLGACIVDYDKKRALANQLTMENIRKAKKQSFGGIIAQSISIKTKTRSETIRLDEGTFKDCIFARRFALIDGEKGTLEVKMCRAE